MQKMKHAIPPDVPEKQRQKYETAYAVQRVAVPSKMVEMGAWQFGATRITPANPDNPKHKDLIDTVVRYSMKQNIGNIPAIFIVDSPINNAASVRGKELMFTTGMMDTMSKEELDAIAGHELSHHRHNFRDDALRFGIGFTGATIADLGWKHGAEFLHNKGMLPFTAKFMLQSTTAALVPIWFGSMAAITPYQHFMEFEADKEGAQLAGKRAMKSALNSLASHQEELKEKMENLEHKDWKHKVYNTLMSPFTTHPSSERRVAAIESIKPTGSHAERIKSEQLAEQQASI
ncbi:MAG: M48 family metalloprotease [Rickettsiales bacterium]|nr:M48 family metalloprotease [Rickettsiales bacterium]